MAVFNLADRRAVQQELYAKKNVKAPAVAALDPTAMCQALFAEFQGHQMGHVLKFLQANGGNVPEGMTLEDLSEQAMGTAALVTFTNPLVAENNTIRKMFRDAHGKPSSISGDGKTMADLRKTHRAFGSATIQGTQNNYGYPVDSSRRARNRLVAPDAAPAALSRARAWPPKPVSRNSAPFPPFDSAQSFRAASTEATLQAVS